MTPEQKKFEERMDNFLGGVVAFVIFCAILFGTILGIVGGVALTR